MRAQLQNAVLAIVFSVLIWAAVGAQLSEVKTIEIDYIVDVPSDVTISQGERHETGDDVERGHERFSRRCVNRATSPKHAPKKASAMPR